MAAPPVEHGPCLLHLLGNRCDESEILTYFYLAHCWAERGADLRVEAPGPARKRAVLGVLDHAGDKLIVITSESKRSSDFADLLACLDRYNQFEGFRRA
jgi:hypothetical protein